LVIILLLSSCHSLDRDAEASKPAALAHEKTANIRESQDDIDAIVERAIETANVSELPEISLYTNDTRRNSIEVDSLIQDLLFVVDQKNSTIIEKDKEIAELKAERDKEASRANLWYKIAVMGGLGVFGLVSLYYGINTGRFTRSVMGVACFSASISVGYWWDDIGKYGLPAVIVITFLIYLKHHDDQKHGAKTVRIQAAKDDLMARLKTRA